MSVGGRACRSIRKSIGHAAGIPCFLRSAGRCRDHLHFSMINSLQDADTEDVGITKPSKERVSFAKSLACLSEENISPINRKPPIPRELNDFEKQMNKTSAPGQPRDSKFQGAMQEARIKVNANESGHESISLAKSLACLPDEIMGDKRKPRTRMELKRALEMRIKKRVKEQRVNGKFCDIWEKVISEPSTLKDSYDIIRLNSNSSLGMKGDEICFDTIADQLKRGDFDVNVNAFSFSVKGSKSEGLVLPNLKLRVIQEAIRVVLEVVYRPSFSRISHACRSGRGPMSALRFVTQEMCRSDWWFTLHMKKKDDNMILSNLISFLQEKIEDAKLFSTIQLMFETKVLRLEFGGYPKGQGLPQEGALSPILMNIYLGNLDSELFRIFIRYEGLSMDSKDTRDGQSKLRQWVRRQMKGNNVESEMDPGVRLHACRYMDEIVVAVSGPRQIAVDVRKEICDYMKKSLYINMIDHNYIQAVNDASSHGIQFVGMVISASPHETRAVRAVHKLNNKVKLFAAQKKEAWDTGMVRIGKKWLAYSLKRIKESEIKQLGLSEPLLDQISHHRKEGMKTEHWFNVLIKIWLQDVRSAMVDNGVKAVLAKHIAEPAVPQELRESFYKFQQCAKKYISSETSSTLELLSNIGTDKKPPTVITKIDAPIYHIQKKLMSYGLVNDEGFPRYVSALILHDDTLIVQWFSGIVKRWLKWYSKHDNFKDVKSMMLEYIQKSCIRTLAAKHKVDESLIEKRFELELNGIPLTEDLETDLAALTPDPCNDDDEALMYGILHNGLCQLSLSRIEEPSKCPTCAILGCSERSPCIYTINTRDQQKFPGWKTGFATGIHPSLNKEKFALCNQHVKDLYLGNISLQSVEFGCLKG